MAIVGSIKCYLDEQGLAYETVRHRQALTSGDEARALGVTPAEVAKTIVVRSQGGDALVVLPASARLDMHKLRDVLGDNHARLASEEEMQAAFNEFELGAVPPLGELIGARVYLDEKLEQMDEVVFAGGTHMDSVKMSGEDFLKLIHPRVADLTQEPGAELLY